MRFKGLYIIAIAFLTLSSCSLDETNYSSTDSSNYFKGDDQFEELALQPYSSLRTVMREISPMFLGTDIYERQGVLNDVMSPINDYTPFTNYEYAGYWTYNYDVITNVNRTISRGLSMDLSDGLYEKRIAELKALRAFCYFNLVESFGGVVLLVEEITTPIYDFERDTEEATYNLIISDLEDAIALLPDQPENFGRVGQGMANHLLAQVYLARSEKSFGGGSSDLDKAITCAEKAISLHPMLTGTDSWKTLFEYGSSQATEVIFSARYGTDVLVYGNNIDREFKFAIDAFPGVARSAPYWRPSTTAQPTTHFFELFDDNDIRLSEDYLKRTLYASSDVEYDGQAIVAGDPIMYFPKTKLTDSEIADYKAANPTVYLVVNPDEYYTYTYGSYTAFPFIWKFYDSNIAEYTDALNGTRDTYIFRSAGTKLLLAEAYVKKGNGSAATLLINELRSRAGADLLVSDATIDDVLDESAREQFGEANRWMELKRAGKLSERVMLYNEHAKHHNSGSIDDKFLLRPIPQAEIDQSSGTLTQNPGYGD